MNSKDSTYTGFEFEIEGNPAIAIINADLKNLPGREEYRYSVFVTLLPDRVNEFGHPVEDEYDYLNNVEKSIIDYLEAETRTVHVGHTTLYRKREVIFYTQDAESVESFLEQFLPSIERSYDFELEDDPEWENVSAFYELL